MAETLHYDFNNNPRNPGGVTITFVGPNAANLKTMFEGAYSESSKFREDVEKAATRAKDVSIGSFDELQLRPGFADSGITSDRLVGRSEVMGFSNPETYFIVVPDVAHTLRQVDPARDYPGDTQMAMVHGFTHIPQYLDMFKPGGAFPSETANQIREQDIAVQLGKTPGVDFPDIKGQPGDAPNPYVVIVPPAAPSDAAEPGVPTLKVDPTNFENEFGHPFNGSQQDVDLLKAGIFDGSISASGRYVDEQSDDRYIASFGNPIDDRIVVSADTHGLTVSTVNDNALDQIIRFDTQNHLVERQLFDPADAQPWSAQTIDYAPDGRVSAEQTIDDSGSYSLRTNNPDGTHTITTSASDGADLASAVTRHYDAADHLISETVHNDDGSARVVTHDTEDRSWETQTAFFDPAHNLRSETIDYDEGWQSVRVNDLDGAEPWSASYAVYNDSDQLEWQDVLNDNGGEPLVISDGKYVADAPDWPDQIAQLKGGGSVVTKLYACFGGGGPVQDFSTIKTIYDARGTFDGTRLKANLEVFRQTFPAFDGIDMDCEDVYDVPSFVAFCDMMIGLGFSITFCPFAAPDFWNAAQAQVDAAHTGAVKWWNLQCYDGGAGNNPQDWVSADTPAGYIIPGDWVRFWDPKPPSGPPRWFGHCPKTMQNLFATFKNQTAVGGGFVYDLDLVRDTIKNIPERGTGCPGKDPQHASMYLQFLKAGLGVG